MCLQSFLLQVMSQIIHTQQWFTTGLALTVRAQPESGKILCFSTSNC